MPIPAENSSMLSFAKAGGRLHGPRPGSSNGIRPPFQLLKIRWAGGGGGHLTASFQRPVTACSDQWPGLRRSQPYRVRATTPCCGGGDGSGKKRKKAWPRLSKTFADGHVLTNTKRKTKERGLFGLLPQRVATVHSVAGVG
ncbi:hypothetical protein CIHG_09024 [Coccidioides immitis H538.4]|uniref:Uncharacterized protein n=3 Tax=Coccidioides immitis TaxID=5501 RepID=A0A0J8QZN4_COCIT|nr:hypothetical protein CIRG_05853 [Coccidioides immitis RMSCC 2394]KMU78359.1 hypothetical protein CISG_06595 [Coccidioides immitis RMSCC 3703]KMU91212.1 hypothetical protein CIHG_09024 [Coccidioides immitis H538.4]